MDFRIWKIGKGHKTDSIKTTKAALWAAYVL